jgi:hypothetical protein
VVDQAPGGGQRRAAAKPGPREARTGPRLTLVPAPAPQPPGLCDAIDIACAIVLALRPDQLDLANPLAVHLARTRIDRRLRGGRGGPDALRTCLQAVPVPEWDDRWSWACATARHLYPENLATKHIPNHAQSLIIYE